MATPLASLQTLTECALRAQPSSQSFVPLLTAGNLRGWAAKLLFSIPLPPPLLLGLKQAELHQGWFLYFAFYKHQYWAVWGRAESCGLFLIFQAIFNSIVLTDEPSARLPSVQPPSRWLGRLNADRRKFWAQQVRSETPMIYLTFNGLKSFCHTLTFTTCSSQDASYRRKE